MMITTLQNNDTGKDAVTDENIQHCCGSLPENFNAIKMLRKEMLNAFDST
jgi:hypothetical protein